MDGEIATNKALEAGAQILRHAVVSKRLGVSASKLFDMVARGVFPRPFTIIPGGRAVGWLESDVDSWILNQREAGNRLITGNRRAR
jgi:prophage regulatory protein